MEDSFFGQKETGAERVARSLSLKFKSGIKTVGYTVHGGAKRSSIYRFLHGKW